MVTLEIQKAVWYSQLVKQANNQIINLQSLGVYVRNVKGLIIIIFKKWKREEKPVRAILWMVCRVEHLEARTYKHY